MDEKEVVDMSEGAIVHSPFFPEHLRSGDQVFADIHFAGGQTLRDVQVWRMSPLGLELKLPQENALLLVEQPITIEVDLRYPSGAVKQPGILVGVTEKGKQGTIFGVRWISSELKRGHTQERRQNQRWIGSAGFRPTGMAPNPLRFNDFIHFQVSDFSAKGLSLVTSLRNKLLVPGMRLETMITFPLIGNISCTLEIVHPRVVDQGGKYFLALGCKLINPDTKLLQVIGSHLLQFGPDVTADSLRKEGMPVETIASAVTFSNVKSKADYEQVLDLRRRAWSASGKFKSDEPLQTFSDIYDSRARILTATYNGRAIASLRILFPDDGGELEHSQFAKLPDDLPRRDEMVEITKVVVDPAFRRGDLLFSLFHQAAIACLQSSRRYILGNSDASLLPLYSKIGFRILDCKFENPKFGVEGKVFIGDIAAGVTGEKVNPIVWNLMYSDLLKYLSKSQLLELEGLSRARVGVYRLFAPLAAIVRNRMSSRPSKRKAA